MGWSTTSLTERWSQPCWPDKPCKKGQSPALAFLVAQKLYDCSCPEQAARTCANPQIYYALPVCHTLTPIPVPRVPPWRKGAGSGLSVILGLPRLLDLCPGAGRSTQGRQAKHQAALPCSLSPRSKKHQPRHGRNPRGALTSQISPATGTRAHLTILLVC